MPRSHEGRGSAVAITARDRVPSAIDLRQWLRVRLTVIMAWERSHRNGRVTAAKLRGNTGNHAGGPTGDRAVERS